MSNPVAGIIPQPIRTDADHDAALERIAMLWDAQPGTPEHDELEALGVLIADHEELQGEIPPLA